jgi:hypothetical protein
MMRATQYRSWRFGHQGVHLFPVSCPDRLQGNMQQVLPVWVASLGDVFGHLLQGVVVLCDVLAQHVAS